MQRYILVVHSNPVAGMEDEYNEWYEKFHLPEVLQVPGVVGAQRFMQNGEHVTGDTPPRRYVSIYEIETDDIQKTVEDLYAAALDMTETLSIDVPNATCVYQAVGPRHEAK